MFRKVVYFILILNKNINISKYFKKFASVPV